MNLCMMSCMMFSASPESIVQTAIDCGMTAIDWVTTHNQDPRYLRKLCDDAGLKIVAHTMLKQKFLQRKNDYLDEFRESLDDACTLGAPILMLPPFARQNQVSMEDDRKEWIEYYSQALPLAQKAGITLTMESTGVSNSPIVTTEEVLEVLHAVPGLKLTLDHGNMQTACDATAVYPLLKDYVVHFHLKDWKIYDSAQPGTTLKRNGKYFADATIGQGDLDLKGFWNHVDEAGRQLYVNLETSDYSEKKDIRCTLKQVADMLRNW